MAKADVLGERLDWHARIGWAITGAGVVLFAVLFGYVFLTLPRGSELDRTIRAVADLDTRLIRMETNIYGLRASQASQNPTDPKNIAQAKSVLAAARLAKLKIDEQVVKDAGTRFIEAAAHAPQAWDAAQAFLDYRSYLNVDIVPKLTPATGKSKYQTSVTSIPNPEYPGTQRAYSISFAGGYATPDKSARLETLTNPQSEGSEFAFFKIEGGMDTIVLDGEYMKHVIVQNADVQYDGGPIRLEDVYFVNCTFHSKFKLTPTTIRLGREILTAAAVTFGSGTQPASGL